MRINRVESEADGRMGALYRLCRGLQGNRLVILVCLDFLFVLLNQINQTNQTDQINQINFRMLRLAGRLCLFSLEFGPAVVEPLRGCAGCVQRLGSFL